MLPYKRDRSEFDAPHPRGDDGGRAGGRGPREDALDHVAGHRRGAAGARALHRAHALQPAVRAPAAAQRAHPQRQHQRRHRLRQHAGAPSLGGTRIYHLPRYF